MTKETIQYLFTKYGEEKLEKITFDNPRHIAIRKEDRENNLFTFDFDNEIIEIKELGSKFESFNYNPRWLVYCISFEQVQALVFDIPEPLKYHDYNQSPAEQQTHYDGSGS